MRARSPSRLFLRPCPYLCVRIPCFICFAVTKCCAKALLIAIHMDLSSRLNESWFNQPRLTPALAADAVAVLLSLGLGLLRLCLGCA